jgi:Cu2+-exporting ATPase
VTRSHAVETLARASHFVFDKTGTLTTGEMCVLEVLPLGTLDPGDSLALAAALEQASEHPIGRPCGRLPRGVDMPAVDGPGNEPGSGISAQHGGRRCASAARTMYSGAARQALAGGRAVPAASGDTVIALGDESGWIALFRLGDEPRPEAAAMVAACTPRAAGGAADR